MHHLIGQLLVDRNDAEFQEVFITSLWRAARRNLRGNVNPSQFKQSKNLNTGRNTMFGIVEATETLYWSPAILHLW